MQGPAISLEGVKAYGGFELGPVDLTYEEIRSKGARTRTR
jgi:hypothetical protein